MKKTVGGNIIYKAPPVIKEMKTKERYEQYFELESEEPEMGKLQFVFICQDPDILKWWENAVAAEVSYWPYLYYKTDFPIRAVKTTEIKPWKNAVMRVRELREKERLRREAERRKRIEEKEKKEEEERKRIEEETGMKNEDWHEEQWFGKS